jgi:AraC-like DNA-binding protein
LRVLRLQAFVAGRRNGAGAALDAGYFDQAHLIREFRELAGMTPGQYFGMSDLSNPPSPLSS